ncbi:MULTISPECIES: hypothetical protein [unclassified Cryobacterium]|uniref:hypothetical protein n=1 Tax=unclassified Cryobacterium TaxID=2649013 RepID=UPI002AB41C7E|nr:MULTISPECIES: hypothetical protein [unclassified Cryobacterium]MDY7527022.1 hypothetical protein [Cryobacterium sp. 10C2]MDY7557183.1 hypothetical protein [Cryobacterium sp. 10C3]MEB0004232.1 hypothetical protein [Cryobacterium sp. RTC2.1]MEB0203514.1 hypothetical protein [Cryobacterium sp. 5I3]MEB0287633.1 hypothetical protein [Cryobacterium sp. 10S3]
MTGTVVSFDGCCCDDYRKEHEPNAKAGLNRTSADRDRLLFGHFRLPRAQISAHKLPLHDEAESCQDECGRGPVIPITTETTTMAAQINMFHNAATIRPFGEVSQPSPL